MINWSRTDRDTAEDQHCRGNEVEDNPRPYTGWNYILRLHIASQLGVVSACSHYQYIASSLNYNEIKRERGRGVCVCVSVELKREDIMSCQGKTTYTHCGWPHPHLYQLDADVRRRCEWCRNLTLPVILISVYHWVTHNHQEFRQQHVCLCAPHGKEIDERERERES